MEQVASESTLSIIKNYYNMPYRVSLYGKDCASNTRKATMGNER